MSFRAKLLSLFLLGLLILPSFIGPRTDGDVLGVLESKPEEQVISNQNYTNSQIGQIASGAFETKVAQTDSVSEKSYAGKAVWDENAKSKVITDKFSIGNSIKISSQDKTLNLIVGDVRVLGQDTILVLNRETFELLGGDPDTQDSIEVSVVTD